MRKFFFFRSVPFQYVCSFRFTFSHKPKSKCPDGRPLFFFSRPRPNVNRLRRPGAARAQPCVGGWKTVIHTWLSYYMYSAGHLDQSADEMYMYGL